MLPAAQKNPQKLKNRIQDQLLWDSRVNASDINVEVIDGTARLTGTVPTYSDRRYAGLDALLTAGINDVDNRLIVRYPQKYAIPTDDGIAENLRNAFRWNSNIDASQIVVSVNAGIVTLTGSVDMYWKKFRAEQIAADMTGVTNVVNELTIVPTRSYSDQAIAKDIESSFARNTSLDVKNIDVKVSNGRVTLTGTVPDGYSFRQADYIARYTAGVISIDNQLVIV